jgi:hypothetical protein
MSGPLGPFGDTFERLGDTPINKVADEIFGAPDAARSTRVIIYNHSGQDLFPISNSFSSGGFTAGQQPHVIEAGTAGGYRVESHGFATGVTAADVRFGLSPSDGTVALRIVTSNPFAGDNSMSAEADQDRDLVVNATSSVGNANQVDVDVFTKT